MFHPYVPSGDGIGTNDAAARVLLKHMWEFADSFGIQYFLIVILCASHQSNLVVAAAICGGRHVKDPTKNNAICAACSRFYKHLLVDYSEEFAIALWTFVERAVVLVSVSDVDVVQKEHTENLRKLYGDSVLPSDLMELYADTIAKLRHVGACKQDACRLFYHALHKYCFRPEEHPITSRFWTFSVCVDGLLRVVLLDLPVEVFSVTTTRPRPDNQKRLKLFHDFLQSAEGGQTLRIASLSLQLTAHATSLTAQKAQCGLNREPTLVRLGKREIQQKTCQHFIEIVSRLHLDPKLDIGRAFWSLLNTEAELLIRFEWYCGYPTKLWELCEEFNGEYYKAVYLFLNEKIENLDFGYTARIWEEAWYSGDFQTALNYLTSKEMQSEMASFVRRASAVSLAVEKQHKAAKEMTEMIKVKSVSTCSRDAILQAFRSDRSRQFEQNKRDAEFVKKNSKMNSWALAVRERSDLAPRPRGKLHWEEDISEKDMQALVHVGDILELKTYHAENHTRLKLQAAGMIKQAQLLAQKTKECPLSNAQLLEYMNNNPKQIHDLMESAGADRKVLSQRLTPMSEDMRYESARTPRMQAKRADDLTGSPLVAKVASAGSGFYCFDAQSPQTHVLFCQTFAGEGMGV